MGDGNDSCQRHKYAQDNGRNVVEINKLYRYEI